MFKLSLQIINYQQFEIILSTELIDIRIFLSLNFTPFSFPSQNQRYIVDLDTPN